MRHPPSLQKSSLFKVVESSQIFAWMYIWLEKRNCVFDLAVHRSVVFFHLLVSQCHRCALIRICSPFSARWNRPISLYGENAWGAFHSFPISFSGFFALSTILLWFPIYFYSVAAALLPLNCLPRAAVFPPHAVLKQLSACCRWWSRSFLLVYLQTRFRVIYQSISVVFNFDFDPEVVANDMWLHPESLEFLLIVLTLFFPDTRRSEVWEKLLYSALFCGLATATKLLGLFFFLTIPLYISGMVIKNGSACARSCSRTFLSRSWLWYLFIKTLSFFGRRRERCFKIQSNSSLNTRFHCATKYSPPWSGSVIFDLYSRTGFLILAMTASDHWNVKGERRLINLFDSVLGDSVHALYIVRHRDPSQAFSDAHLRRYFSALPAYFHRVDSARLSPLSDYLKNTAPDSFLFVLASYRGLAFVYSLNMDIPPISWYSQSGEK